MRSCKRPPLSAPLRMFLPAAALLLPVLFSGCQNSCQRICSRMANYAEDCGVDVSKQQIKDCREAQSGKQSREDRSACREFGGSKDIEEQWDCDEVASYWGVPDNDTESDSGTEE